MFRADRQSVLFEGAGEAGLHIDMAVGTATYVYQYGSNATYTATLDQWWSDYYADWVSWPESYVGTNRWTIDPAGALIGDPDSGAPLDYNTWTRRSNNIPVATYQDTFPYFSALENIQAKGTIPSLGRTNMDCKLDLVILGDRSDFTNDVIVKFTITATNADTGVRIPDSDITIYTKPVTNGVAWKKFKEWSTPDVTPVISGHDNYTFELSAEIGRPNIMLDDANITGLTLTNWNGTTNKLYVGELFWPYVTLGSWNNLVTNYWWTVPGGRVKDWYADLSNGFEIPFVDLDHCTNIDVWCSFVYPLTNAYLGCQIQIMGETLRPWSLINIHTPPVSVAWDTNPITVDENWLQFGTNTSWETGGVRFTNSITGDAGFGAFTFVQTLGIYRERHWDSFGDYMRQYLSGEDLLDGNLPYRVESSTATGLSTADTPGSMTGNDGYRKISDRFSMYLMWKSSLRAGSIPATRWRFDWIFQAEATNAPGSGWSLVPGSTNGSVTTSTESGRLPFWTNNVQTLIQGPWQPIP